MTPLQQTTLSPHLARPPRPPRVPYLGSVPTPRVPPAHHADSPPLLSGPPPAPFHSQKAGAGGANEAAHGDIYVGDPALGALEAVTIPGLARAAQLPHPATPHLRSRLGLRLSPADPATWPWALFRRHHHVCPLPRTSSPQVSNCSLNHCPLPASSVASARSASLTEARSPQRRRKTPHPLASPILYSDWLVSSL